MVNEVGASPAGTTTERAVGNSSSGNKHKAAVVISLVMVLLISGAVLGVLFANNNDFFGTNKASSTSGTNSDAGTTTTDLADPSGTTSGKIQPSTIPSDSPSMTPSNSPSNFPSSSPSDSPSVVPSSSPSDGPSNAPTSLYIDPNPVPPNPPRGYFNYDMNDNRYGPNGWGRVDTSRHFLREFDSDGFGPFRGHLTSKEPTLNRCGGPDRRQSPKNLVETLACEAHHEIRSKCGTYGIHSPHYERLILPHKLSLVMNRRPCLNPDNSDCDRGRPPLADYPRYSSGLTAFSDLLNLDIKVPGEHTLEGVGFDAELQLFHTHLDPSPPRVSSIGIPVRATLDGYNDQFQDLLNQFQATYNDHRAACNRRRNLRQTTSPFYEWMKNTTKLFDEEEYKNYTQQHLDSRKLNQATFFNPYSEAFMPNIFFYRYDGSITEPPCFAITWWVMIDPMIISFEQLFQLKYILFTHVDGDCQRTSVHNADQSVARPIYPLGEDREIQKCKSGDFVSDEAKGRGDGNICRAFF